MIRLYAIAAWAFFFISTCIGQKDMKDYEGGWEGKITNPLTFNFIVTVNHVKGNSYCFEIKNDRVLIEKEFSISRDRMISFNIGTDLSFEAVIADNHSSIKGFIRSGILQYHVCLFKNGPGNFSGTWNMLMVDKLSPADLYLSVENAEGVKFEAYPIFGDDRFTGTWCGNFEKNKDTIYFSDFKTGLRFEGVLNNQAISLKIKLEQATIAKVEMKRSNDTWEIGNKTNHGENIQCPPELSDGWAVSGLNAAGINSTWLQKMIDSISANKITHTHSVLIARKGILVFEKYFSGYNSTIPHDTRSMSKSISSALIGIAIDQKRINSVNDRIYQYIPEKYQYTKRNDSLKTSIELRHLLTMSSGLDAIDFGINRKSAASEDNYQSTPDWLKTVLEAPMIHTPGSHANYGSANPFLLGVALNSVMPGQVTLFMDQYLFSPLGIDNYIVQNDLSGQPYFGGGMYLTPRDMLKFGQLYLNKGKWNGKEIISEKWIEASFGNYLTLENVETRNGYGYLWWHNVYHNGNKVKSIEARGAGGQYIFVIPEYEMVIAVTSGNYRNGRFWQPEKIVENYILPAILSTK